MWSGVIAGALLSFNAWASPRCDVLELNTVLNASGSAAYTQVILWEWSPDYRRLDCMGYVMVDNPRQVWRTSRGLWVNGREIVAPIVRVTVTRHDPERESSRLFPAQHRPTWPCHREDG